MLQTCIIVVMVNVIMMVGMTTTTKESLQVNGSPQLGYYVQLGLGTPYEEYNFLVDTGSSNFVIAGVKQTNILLTFDPSRSSTFIDYHKTVEIEYSQGGFSGYLGSDRLQFISFYISDVPVVVVNESWNLFGNYSEWQGILGLAFDSLTKPSPEKAQSVLTLLHQQHSNFADVFSLRLCPPLDIYGEINLPRKSNMVLGGVDRNDYYGDIYYTPIVKQQYYNVLFSNISVDGVMIPLQCSELNNDVTIVDSGTSEVFLNEVVFAAVVKLLKKHFMGRDYSPPDGFWTASEQLLWPANRSDIYDVFPTITFYFPLHENASMQFGVTMPPQLYLRKVERVNNSYVSCDEECDLFVFSIRSKPSGSLLGNNLMNGYNVVFDRHNMRLGFAVTSCDLRDNSYDQPNITDPQPRDSTIDCSYHSDKTDDNNIATTTTESLQVNGSPQLGYYVQLGLGTPYEGYNFLVDTGSSNLVIAGVKQTNLSFTFNPSKSSTFIDYHKTVEIEYSQGGFSGYLGSDRLQFISFYISDVTIAVIEKSWNFFGTDPQWQGILGLAFDSLMKPSPEEAQSVLTLMQQQHSDIADVFSLRLCPPLDIYGEINLPRKSNMVLGGVDRNDYYGDIYYTPIVKQQYYNVLFSNISVDGVMIPLQCSELNDDDVTIIDSGTSEVFLNEAVFGAVIKLLKKYFMRRDDYSPPDGFWTASEKLSWPAYYNDIYTVFPTITFYFPLHDNASMQFGVTMPPQLYLRKVDGVTGSDISCDEECDLFVFSIRSKPSGSLLGNNLMNGYNVVFDRHNMRLGFAVTSCDLRDNTGSHDQPKINDPQPREVCSNHHGNEPSQIIRDIVVPVISVAVILAAAISLIVYYLCNRRKNSHGLVRLQEECDIDDPHDNTINDQPTVQAAQEVLGRSTEVQVGLTTPSEADQMQYSKETMKELIHKQLFDKYHSSPSSSLVF